MSDLIASVTWPNIKVGKIRMLFTEVIKVVCQCELSLKHEIYIINKNKLCYIVICRGTCNGRLTQMVAKDKWSYAQDITVCMCRQMKCFKHAI